MRPEYCPERVKMPDCHPNGVARSFTAGPGNVFNRVPQRFLSSAAAMNKRFYYLIRQSLQVGFNESLIGLRWIHNLPTKHLYTQRRD
jgi:hypothetical protein